tara:strand:+ start:381 stop:614 length:234 start_codon:yes stop_codon:yes gene_type:complete
MTIREKQQSDKIIVDLTGRDGNAFSLIGLAHDLCKQLNRMGLDYDFDSIYKQMTLTDYENLVRTFDDYFGHLVILER